jgi:hypothetical protein
MNGLVSRGLFDKEVANLSRLAGLRGWRIHSTDFPILDIQFERVGKPTLRLRMIATDWNDMPPSFELLTPDGSYLPPVVSKLLPGGVLNNTPHRNTKRPFICMIGSKEYHTHENHLNDPWDNYRNKDGISLVYILSQIWNAWLLTSL